MSFDKSFNKIFNKFDYLSSNSKKLLESILKEKSLLKNEILFHEGLIEDKFVFITSGIIRISHHENTKSVKTILFLKEGEVISSYESFIKKIPSKTRHTCITNCTFLECKYTDLIKIALNNIEILRCLSEILEVTYLRIYDKVQFLTLYESQERYKMIKDKFPKIESYVSSKEIASYLNISPTQLSRVRKKYYKNYA